MESAVQISDFIIGLFGSEIANTARVGFYIIGAVGLWRVALQGISRRWKFKYLYLAIAIHMCVAAGWATMVAAKVPPPAGLLSVVFTLTTGFMAFGTISGFISSEDL